MAERVCGGKGRLRAVCLASGLGRPVALAVASALLAGPVSGLLDLTASLI